MFNSRMDGGRVNHAYVIDKKFQPHILSHRRLTFTLLLGSSSL